MGASASKNREQRNGKRAFIADLQLVSANSFAALAPRPAAGPHCNSEPASESQKSFPTARNRSHRAKFGCRSPAPLRAKSFLCAILQQILQLAHEFLDVLEIHVHAREAHVRNFVELLQAVHDHFADFGGGQLALGGFVHDAFDFVNDAFKLGRRHRPFFAGFQQALQNFLALEAFATAILLDDHVGNFVDALVGGEAASTFEAFAAAANGVAAAAFARINHLVVYVRTERAFHSEDSPWRIPVSPLLPTPSLSSISSSCLAISRNWPSDQPS